MLENNMLSIEIMKGKTLDELYLEYRFLVKPTILKYYSRYIKSMWEDDIYSCAEIGVYEGLKKINVEKIKDETSIRSAIVWSIRGCIKDFEGKMFGSKGSKRRKGNYNTVSYNKELGDKGDNNRCYEEIIDESNALANSEGVYFNEDIEIEQLDLCFAISKLSKDEQYLIQRLLADANLETIGKEMGISKDKAFRIKKKVIGKLKEYLGDIC